MVDVGETAPDFALISDEGKEVSLRDYLGKKVVLYFYPKDGTPGCTQEAKEFRDLAERFGEENAAILGVRSIEGRKNHPQLQRFKNHDNPIHAIGFYLVKIYEEADRRGLFI